MAYKTEIIEFAAEVGKEYIYTAYPGPGIYFNAKSHTTYIVTTSCVFAASNFKPEPVAEGTAGLDSIARVLAVALHSNAAVALINADV